MTRSGILWYPLLAVLSAAQTVHPTIPRAWDDNEVKGFEVPLAQPDRSPRYLSSDQYYLFRVRPVYRGYPVYFPGREPLGYLGSLRQKEPEITLHPGRLHTEEDWNRAERVRGRQKSSPMDQKFSRPAIVIETINLDLFYNRAFHFQRFGPHLVGARQGSGQGTRPTRPAPAPTVADPLRQPPYPARS